MVCNIFYYSKTAKIHVDSNITNIREIYVCIEVSMHFFIVFNILIHFNIRLNIRIGGNKKYRFSILFLFQFAK